MNKKPTKTETVPLKVKGYIHVEDQYGNILYDGPNATTEAVPFIIVSALKKVAGENFSEGIIEAVGDFGSNNKNIDDVSIVTDENHITSQATFSPESFTGNITGFKLKTQTQTFSIVSGLNIDKTANIAISVSWKIIFNIT